MAKLAPTSTKYLIKAHIKAKGVIEKPDVIGAVFGQTEGLLGSDLDLRELQRTGRIGRIEVNIKSVQGNSEGEIIIPSSLDSAETALIAATLETIERIGPCIAAIKLESVEDNREEKRKYIVDKAKDILKGLMDSGVPNPTEISEQIKEAVRSDEITTYRGLPCGPGVMDSEEIIVVEGRADVINLLRYGIRNAVAVGGTLIPDSIIELTKEKTVILFVDGDRGGKLISKDLVQRADIDFVATAAPGKEVEELTKKEVYKSLRDKISVEQFLSETKNGGGLNGSDAKNGTARPSQNGPVAEAQIKAEPEFHSEKFHSERDSYSRRYDRRPARHARRERGRGISRRAMPRPPEARYALRPEQKDLFKKTLEELVGSRAAYIFNEKNELMGKVPVAELENTVKTLENPHAIVFDGRIDYAMNDMAKRRDVKFLIGMEKENIFSSVNIFSKADLGI